MSPEEAINRTVEARDVAASSRLKQGPPLPDTTPITFAKAFLHECHSKDDKPQLFTRGDDLFLKNCNGFNPIEKQDVIRQLYEWMEKCTIDTKDGPAEYFVTDHRVENVFSALRAVCPQLPLPSPMSVADLCEGNPELYKPLIHGLLREGETMQINAPAKFRKSFGVTQLAISLAVSRCWLDHFQTEGCHVLIIDNELHRPTSAYRIKQVAAAMGVPLNAIAERIFVVPLRGQLRDIYSLRPMFSRIDRGMYGAIIIDALYRMLPAGVDENDNSAMAQVYNQIDAYAEQTGAAFVLVHHSSKGIQSTKRVTDVGSGAGSQSRAVDAHLILREHEENDAVVMEAAVRSFAPMEPLCIRWDYPIWKLAPDLDPTRLKRETNRQKAAAEPQEPGIDWTAAKFVESFVTQEPHTMDLIVAKATAAKMSERGAKRWVTLAVAEGLIHRWTYSSKRKPHQFSTEPQPLSETV